MFVPPVLIQHQKQLFLLIFFSVNISYDFHALKLSIGYWKLKGYLI